MIAIYNMDKETLEKGANMRSDRNIENDQDKKAGRTYMQKGAERRFTPVCRDGPPLVKW